MDIKKDETLADLVARLRKACIESALIDEIIERVQRDRAETTARAARLFYGSKPGEPMENFGDRLEEAARRAYGVELCARGLVDEVPGAFADGLLQLLSDLSYDLDRLAQAYRAEKRLDFPAKTSHENAASHQLTQN